MPDDAKAQIDAAMPELQSWIGRKQIVEDEIGLTAVRRIAGMLDLDPDGFRNGTILPAQWFGLFFAPVARQSDIGPDGHPRKGLFLPPIPLPRRMGAGRRAKIMGNLVTGQAARRISEVLAITPKHGRTGHMVVLTMRQTTETAGKEIAVEEFDAVYREAVPPGQKNPAPKLVPAPADPAWSKPVELSSPLVFRYSAVTWNAHRIHYDADYSRAEEGYPNVVQNGGLTIQLMLEAAVANMPGRITGFEARLARPLWVGDTVTIAGRAAAGGRMECWAADKEGALSANLNVEYAA
jgi:3-methylfumaryl-CoA hydratase